MYINIYTHTYVCRQLGPKITKLGPKIGHKIAKLSPKIGPIRSIERNISLLRLSCKFNQKRTPQGYPPRWAQPVNSGSRSIRNYLVWPISKFSPLASAWQQ